MKIPLPQIVLSFLLILPLLGRAQEIRVSGRVVDAKTKEPIPFVSLSLIKRNVGSLTDERGQFELNDPLSPGDDSLWVATQDYEPYCKPIKVRSAENIVIELIRLVPAGNSVNTRRSSQKPSEKFLPIFSQYAFLVPNNKLKHFGKMRSVSFYLGLKGLPQEMFRVRIYAVNALDAVPGNDLLFDDITVKPQNGTGWYTLNLDNYSIRLPESGCYIAVEYMIEYRNLTPRVESYTPVGYTLHPSVSPIYCVWGYITDNKQWELCRPTDDFQRLAKMIKLEMNVVE